MLLHLPETFALFRLRLRQPFRSAPPQKTCSASVVLVLSLVWSWVFFLRPNAGGPLKLFGKEYAPTEQGITLGIGEANGILFIDEGYGFEEAGEAGWDGELLWFDMPL